MKSLSIPLVVLMTANVATATLTIIAPDEMTVGETAIVGIDVVGEEALLVGALTFEGKIEVDISEATFVPELHVVKSLEDLTDHPSTPEYLASFGIFDPAFVLYFEYVSLVIPPDIPDGRFIDNIRMTDTGSGMASLTLIDPSVDEVLDRKEVVLGIPEPATITLLALAIAALRRHRT